MTTQVRFAAEVAAVEELIGRRLEPGQLAGVAWLDSARIADGRVIGHSYMGARLDILGPEGLARAVSAESRHASARAWRPAAAASGRWRSAARPPARILALSGPRPALDGPFPTFADGARRTDNRSAMAVHWRDVPGPGAVCLPLDLRRRPAPPGHPRAGGEAVLEVDIGAEWLAAAGDGAVRLAAGAGADEGSLDRLMRVLAANAALWGLDVVPVPVADRDTGAVLAPAVPEAAPVWVTPAPVAAELPGGDLPWLARLLADLGYQCAPPAASGMAVIPPTYRPDITDVHGVIGHAQEHLGWWRVAAGGAPAERAGRREMPPGPAGRVRQALADEGFAEIWRPAIAGLSGSGRPEPAAHLATRNEAGQPLVLRTSIRESLFDYLRGQDRLGAEIKLFDVGLVYRRQGADVHEAWHVGLVWAARSADPAALAATLRSRLGVQPRPAGRPGADRDIREVRYLKSADLDGWVGVQDHSAVSARQRTTVVAEFMFRAGAGL